MSKAQEAECEGFSRQQNKSEERESSSLFKGARKQGLSEGREVALSHAVE